MITLNIQEEVNVEIPKVCKKIQVENKNIDFNIGHTSVATVVGSGDINDESLVSIICLVVAKCLRFLIFSYVLVWRQTTAILLLISASGGGGGGGRGGEGREGELLDKIKHLNV